ncbi:hypothetical protein ACWGH2_16345 [Streptomyces sp. NPDC054871]
MPEPTAAEDLDTITDRWAALQEATGTRTVTSWPPAMGISRLISEEEHQELLDELADTAPDAPGPRPVPVDVDILDVMTVIERELCELVDQLAGQIQRPVLVVATGRGWSDDLHRQAALLAAKDSADPRRWRYSGHRDAPTAAEWLACRIADQPGPFRRLTDGEREAVGRAAARCAERIRRVLGDARRTEPVPQPCPHCRGQLVVEGGDGAPPLVRCEDCGRTWKDRSDDAA